MSELIDGCAYAAAWRQKREEWKKMRLETELRITPPKPAVSGGVLFWTFGAIIVAALTTITVVGL